MNSEIFYFSGTGNSLFVARRLARAIVAKVTPVASVVGKSHIDVKSDALGIIFPCYYASLGESGVPSIVQEFVKKLTNIGTKYIFAVCTHGGFPSSTIDNLSRLLESQGAFLSAGFAVRMSISYSAFDKINHALFHRPLPEMSYGEKESQAILFEKCAEKVGKMVPLISSQTPAPLETPGVTERIVSHFFLKLSNKLFRSRYRKLSHSESDSAEWLTKNADKAFLTNDKCVGCGTCSRICPVGNIVMKDDRPDWQHNCETCYGCYTWCPNAAIYGDIVEYERRYHHPDIHLSDMLWRDPVVQGVK